MVSHRTKACQRTTTTTTTTTPVMRDPRPLLQTLRRAIKSPVSRGAVAVEYGATRTLSACKLQFGVETLLSPLLSVASTTIGERTTELSYPGIFLAFMGNAFSPGALANVRRNIPLCCPMLLRSRRLSAVSKGNLGGSRSFFIACITVKKRAGGNLRGSGWICIRCPLGALRTLSFPLYLGSWGGFPICDDRVELGLGFVFVDGSGGGFSSR